MYDLVVIGGGINGIGIARDAAGRGLSVAVVEKGDLAQATSSNSSKLIHGGLRYLEQYEFRLVHEALKEREVLLRMAPHIAWPMRFRLPHDPNGRPAWLVRLGLWLYDHLGKRVTLPPTSGWRDETGLLKPAFSKGFEYSDLWVDDARLVVLNARQAQQNGAVIMTRTGFETAQATPQGWEVSVNQNGQRKTLQARAVVNAAGPWVDHVFGGFEQTSPHPSRLIKGSHIVVPKIHDRDEAFILPNTDGRVVFVLPYLEDYSLIGTTDVEISGEAGSAMCTPEEETYLVNAVNHFFDVDLTTRDIQWRFSGVRPLLDSGDGDAKAVTRDYKLALTREPSPLLSIHGGKLTTYRKLAEKAVDTLIEVFPNMGPAWTAESVLPGAEELDLEALMDELTRKGVDPRTAKRWTQAYGVDALKIAEQRGEPVIPGLFEGEVRYLVEHEWAQTAYDVLFRRTKLGVGMSEADIALLDDFIARSAAAA